MAHLEGKPAPDFSLAGSDGKTHALKDAAAHPRQVADFLAAR